ncbi:MAG: HAMP domain-containing histidine kinase [Candidatus Eremiobacteraeota bacterium]|nr:HAMP domain-containing histidine kinase [Candidatus Eremiobacteraeota bacterium]
MFKSLRWRLTVWYVTAAFVVLAVIGIITIQATVRGLTANADALVTSASRDAPSVVSNFLSRHRNRLRESAPYIFRYYRDSDLLVALYFKRAQPTMSVGPDIMEPHPPLPGLEMLHPPMNEHRGPPLVAGLLRLRSASVAVPGGFIMIHADRVKLARYLQNYIVKLCLAALFIMIAAVVLAYYVSGQALRPLLETTAALRRFADGDFATPPVLTTDRSELGNLATAYNAAAKQVKAAFAQREKSEDEMRQFIADAGHELRTPLTVLVGYVHVLSSGCVQDAPTQHQIFQTMRAESTRMRDLIDQLILLARLEQPHAPQLTEVNVSDLLFKISESLQHLHGNRLRTQIEADAKVIANENELHEAIVNLVQNALKYAPDSQVDLAVRSDEKTVFVNVRDDGPGMNEEEKRHAFDRFYRGNGHVQTEGSGLGLTIAKRAIDRAKGEIEILSALGTGTTVVVSLPKP